MAVVLQLPRINKKSKICWKFSQIKRLLVKDEREGKHIATIVTKLVPLPIQLLITIVDAKGTSISRPYFGNARLEQSRLIRYTYDSPVKDKITLPIAPKLYNR